MTSLIAAILTIFSRIIIVSGWEKIYYSNGELVTDGVYKYVRHSQYLGILIITTVWLFAWPTLFLIIMYPFLIYAYYGLSKNGECTACEIQNISCYLNNNKIQEGFDYLVIFGDTIDEIADRINYSIYTRTNDVIVYKIEKYN